MSGGFIDPFSAGAAGPVPSLAPGGDVPSLTMDMPPPQPNQGLQQAGGIMQQRNQALAPFRQAAVSEAMQPPPQPPQMQQPPKIGAHDAEKQEADQAWLTAAMFLGTLAGALTRQPLTNALGAFTGAVEGFKEKNDADFKRNLEIWDRENKAVQEANSTALKQYEVILKSRELSFEQKQFALQIKAAELDDDAMQQALQTGNPEVVAQLHDLRTNYGRQLATSSAAFKQEAAQAQAQRWIQSPQGEQMAQAIASGRMQMPSLNQRSPEVMARTQALMARVMDINPNFDANRFNQNRAAATATGRTFGTVEANTQATMAKAVPVIEIAAQAANNVPATVFPRINQLYNTAANEIGDPNIASFKLANEELAMVYAAALNPRSNVVTVSAQEHARALISAAASPEQYQAVLTNLKRLVEQEARVAKQMRESGGAAMPEVNVPPISPNRQTSVPDLIRRTGSQAGQAGASAAGSVAAPFGTPTSQIRGYSRGRGLPAGWSLTPAPPAASPDMPIMQPGQ